MAREILFKAKRVDNGEWVEGYYCKYGFVGKEKHYIIPSYASDLYAFEIDINTLCKYTGLTDKNGRKIWEGDLLKNSDDDLLMVVRWDEDDLRFLLDDYGYRGCLMEYGWDETAGGFGVVETYGFNDFYHINEHSEVIGNIFDNPELLGGADNG